MDDGKTRWNRLAPAERKQKAAGCNEISIEALKQAKHRSNEDETNRPLRSHHLPKRGGSCEPFAKQSLPWRHIRNGRDDSHIKRRADKERQHYGSEKVPRTEFFVGLLGGLGDGFEPSHEVRNDLQHQQNRNQRCCGKAGMKIASRAVQGACYRDDGEENQHRSRCQNLESGAGPNTAIVQRGQEQRHYYSEQETRQKHRLVRDAIYLERIQGRNQIAS